MCLALVRLVASNAQVVINEFSASNYTLGVNGDNEDYIEFYNEGPTEVDLDGHWLSDNPDNLRCSKFQRYHHSGRRLSSHYLFERRRSAREFIRWWELEHQLQGDPNHGGIGGLL